MALAATGAACHCANLLSELQLLHDPASQRTPLQPSSAAAVCTHMAGPLRAAALVAAEAALLCGSSGAAGALAAVLGAILTAAFAGPPTPSAKAVSTPPELAPGQLLELAGQLLGSLPAGLPPAGQQREAALHVAATVQCFVGRVADAAAPINPAAALAVLSGRMSTQAELRLRADRPTAWAAMRLLPSVAAAWRLLAAASPDDVLAVVAAAAGPGAPMASLQSLQGGPYMASDGVEVAVRALLYLPQPAECVGSLRSEEELSEWCAAAEAALAALPDLACLVAGLKAGGREVGLSTTTAGNNLLAFVMHGCLGLLPAEGSCGPGCAHAHHADPAALAALLSSLPPGSHVAAQLRRLHFTACRALFWAAATLPEARGGLEGVNTTHQLHLLSRAAYTVFQAAKVASGSPPGSTCVYGGWVWGWVCPGGVQRACRLSAGPGASTCPRRGLPPKGAALALGPLMPARLSALACLQGTCRGAGHGTGPAGGDGGAAVQRGALPVDPAAD